MAVTGSSAVVLLGARVLFGGVMAFMGLNHFRQTEEMSGYAAHKGLPAPKLAVLGSGAFLVLGGGALVAGVFPTVVATAMAGFLLVSGATMHDFWAVPGEDRQTEMTQFLKNVALAGGALALAALGLSTWEYSLGLTLF
jgi:putative oxidoreductase